MVPQKYACMTSRTSRQRPRLIDRIWGRDVFISYSRADGATYALGLAARLSERKFSCVIDQWGMSTPGTVIPAQLRRLLASCRALVIVATRAAGISVHVAGEIEEFARTPGMIIPIDLDDSIREAVWWRHIEGLPIAIENGGSESKGSNDDVVARICNALTFRRRRLAVVTGSVLLLMVAGIGELAFQSRNLATANASANQDLAKSRVELATNQEAARKASLLAEQQQERAQRLAAE
jgi:hypothetical protein